MSSSAGRKRGHNAQIARAEGLVVEEHHRPMGQLRVPLEHLEEPMNPDRSSSLMHRAPVVRELSDAELTALREEHQERQKRGVWTALATGSPEFLEPRKHETSHEFRLRNRRRGFLRWAKTRNDAPWLIQAVALSAHHVEVLSQSWWPAEGYIEDAKRWVEAQIRVIDLEGEPE